ncbi:MAG: hypothetical protein ACQGVC_24875 [Myxococcota bacterium]
MSRTELRLRGLLTAAVGLVLGFSSTAQAQFGVGDPTFIRWQPTCDRENYTDWPCFLPDEGTEVATHINYFVNTPPPQGGKEPDPRPSVVQIGPGVYTSSDKGLDCAFSPISNQRMNNVTLRGSGRGVTFIGDGTLGRGMEIGNCRDLTVQDLTVLGASEGVLWRYGGTSTWINVDIRAGRAGWRDINVGCDPDKIMNPEQHPPDPPVFLKDQYPFEEAAVHYFFSSRIIVDGTSGTDAIAFEAGCSDNWFYSSEIAVITAPTPSPTLASATGFRVLKIPAFPGIVHAFDTNVRVSTLATTGLSAGFDAAAVSVEAEGIFHMHGGMIETDVSNVAGAQATGLRVVGGGATNAFAHTPDTAFAVRPGAGGTAVRVESSGSNAVALPPKLWAAGDAPPHSGLVSLEGQDLFVETDCSSDGNCNGGGNQAHVMVYSQGCSPEPWFDTVTGRCRNDTTP